MPFRTHSADTKKGNQTPMGKVMILYRSVSRNTAKMAQLVTLRTVCISVALLVVAARCGAADRTSRPAWFKESAARLETELVAKCGEAQRARLQRGLKQCGGFWRAEDGDAAAFETFVRRNFAGDQATLDAMFARFERLLEKLDGHMTELRYAFRLHTDLDRGPVLPFDETLAGYEPAAHVTDDFFANKLAFVVLLNWPLTTLDQRLAEGEKWSRRQWAEVRLAQRFAKRIPAGVLQAVSQSQADAELYINEYKICMHHLLDKRGERPFPPKLRLVPHWNLRDEIKAQYGDRSNGLARQRMIEQVLYRIMDQSIPQVVIDNPQVDWNPLSNEVRPSTVNDLGKPAPSGLKVTAAPEPNTRYAMLLAVFRANKRVDPYSATAPTLIARRFEDDRQMSEARVKAMLEQVLTSPQFAEAGRLVEKRLGRPLEPFDIWYNGFRPHQTRTEAQLDEIVRKKYPTAAAFRDDMPDILVKLGFSPERAVYLRGLIDVEGARGTGHAAGVECRGVARGVAAQVGHGHAQLLHQGRENAVQLRAMRLFPQHQQEPRDVVALGHVGFAFRADELPQGRVPPQLAQQGFAIGVPQGDLQDEHAPQHMHGILVAAAAAMPPQPFQQLGVGQACQDFADGFQAWAVFEAVPGEERFRGGDDHGGPPCGAVWCGAGMAMGPRYTATHPRVNPLLVEKSKKMRVAFVETRDVLHRLRGTPVSALVQLVIPQQDAHNANGSYGPS